MMEAATFTTSLLLIAAGFGLAALIRYLSLPTAPLCGRCLVETLLIRGDWLHAPRWGGRSLLQRRWCPGCGHEAHFRPSPLGLDAVPPAPAPRTTTLDLKRVDMDGDAVRVLLRCRAEADRWVGKLVFVKADGRACPEALEEFRGGSVAEIAIQAMALPDQVLARRLRNALSG